MTERAGADDGAYFGIFKKLKALDLGAASGDLYGPAFAGFYNRFLGDYVADIPIFEQLLPRADMRVLDLACGAARIGIGLARSGFQVDGVELSPDMIALAHENLAKESAEVAARVRLVQGDMCDFSMDCRYDLVVLGVTSISLLLTAQQRRAMFDCAAAHLKPGGHFIFDTIDSTGDSWRNYVDMNDVWSCETEAGTDLAIVGQQLSADGRNMVFNVYRELIGWDGATTRSFGTSTKAWLPRELVLAELAESRLALIDDFLRHDLRYFVTKGS